jgi:hypothetical protein
LLRRLSEDNDYKRNKEYCEMFGKIMGKHMLSWWD